MLSELIRLDELTELEMQVYLYLLANRGFPVLRESLLCNIWELPADSKSRSVDMCIHRLRVKLGLESIKTFYRKGYSLNIS